MASINLRSNRSAAVKQDAPDTNFSTETEWESPGTDAIYWGFEPLPDEYKYRKLEGVGVTIYGMRTTMDIEVYPRVYSRFRVVEADWSESDITYRNKPRAFLYLPEPLTSASYNKYSDIYTFSGWSELSEDAAFNLTKQALLHGIYAQPRPTSAPAKWASSRHPEYYAILYVSFSNTDAAPSSTQSPTSGYIKKTVDNTFFASFIPSTLTFATLERNTLYIDWKESESGTVTTVDCGNVDSYTFPANTFSGDTVIWRARMACSNGTTYEWPWRTLTTVEPLMTAAPVAPVNEIANGGQPLPFRWTTVSSAGILPTGADLQYSENGSVWTTFGHVDGSATEFVAPATTLPPGTVYWRVRAINGSGVAGPWSEAGIFVNVSAPPQPSLTVDPVPFSVLTWQAMGQQAYRIHVDGHDYGVQFGTAKSFTLPTPLADGTHRAEITVQGTYGLWSEPDVQEFTVTNAGAGTLTLTGEFGADAALSWSGEAFMGSPSPLSDWERGNIRPSNGTNISNATRIRTVDGGIPTSVEALQKSDGMTLSLYCYDADSYLGVWNGSGFETADSVRGKLTDLRNIYAAGATRIRAVYRLPSGTTQLEDGQTLRYLNTAESETFLVYRDGVLIGSTRTRSFLDRTALGTHEYFIIQKFTDGNYVRSNTVSGTLIVETPQIALLSGGDWLKLRLSETSPTQQLFSYQQTISLRHVSGAAYPVLETSGFEDLRGDYDAAFLTAEDADKLLAMRGQVVILKSRGDRVVVGPLAQIECIHNDFYLSCRFSIQQIHWEDFNAQS